MRKIIQILYDHRSTKPSKTLAFLALCDDGTVWRQVEVQNPVTEVHTGILVIVDPTYHTEWEQALDFNNIPKLFARLPEDPAEQALLEESLDYSRPQRDQQKPNALDTRHPLDHPPE